MILKSHSKLCDADRSEPAGCMRPGLGHPAMLCRMWTDVRTSVGRCA